MAKGESGLPLSFQNLVHAISGTLGGAFSISLLFPFETVRTRLQVDDRRQSKLSVRVIRDLIQEEGWQSLYRGWQSLLVSLSITNFVYFYFFYGFRSHNWSSSGDHLTASKVHQNVFSDLIIGIMAGALAVLVSNPFWVVNSRLKLQGVKLVGASPRPLPKDTAYRGVTDCFVKLAKNEGVLALWSGLFSSLVLVTNPAINFMIYEALKRNILPVLQNFVSESSLYFCFGGFAKLVATIITYPIQVAQTRARTGIETSSKLHRATKWQRLSFWFRGLESKLVQTVLTSALMLLTYEHIKAMAIFLLQIYLG